MNKAAWIGVALGALLVAVLTPAVTTAEESPSLDARTRDALVSALDDEREAQALYGAIMERFGTVRPFVNIIEAERRHEQFLLLLFQRYEVPVPPRRELEITVPDTLVAACAAGVAFERENVAMYDGFLAFVSEPDIRQTFTLLRDASLNRHLPAFERCMRPQGRRGGRWAPGR